MLKVFAALTLLLLTVSGAAAAPQTILALGDSLTAGLGLGADGLVRTIERRTLVWRPSIINR